MKALLDAGADVDLVFSDVRMPGRMDGFILASWVRQHHPGIELILTPGTASASDRAGDLCQDGQVIPKPYDQQTVLKRIEALLRNSRRTGPA